MAKAYEQLRSATTEFCINVCDNTELRMQQTLKTPDGHVQWHARLAVSPHASNSYSAFVLNFRAEALSTEAPSVSKLVNASCQLTLWERGPNPCVSCYKSGRRCGSACCHHEDHEDEYNKIPVPFLEMSEGPCVCDTFDLEVPKIEVPHCTNRNAAVDTSNSIVVRVTLSHHEPVKEVKKQSPGDHCVYPTTLQKLKELLDSGEMSDVTFVVSDEEVKAHTLILGAVSDVFKAMFHHDTLDRRTGRIKIEDTNVVAFKEMLRCLYTDSAPAWTDDKDSDNFVMGLLFLAEKYNLKSLRAQCQRRILNTMTVDNTLERLKALHILSPSMVSLLADPFVKNQITEILSSEAWTAFMKEDPALAADFMFHAMKK